MTKHIPIALSIARKYAEGGDVEEEKPEVPPELMRNVEALSAARTQIMARPKQPEPLPTQPGEQSLTAYHPTMRERIAQWIMGDQPSDSYRGRLVREGLGTTGLGSQSPGLVDITPAGMALGAQESLQHGDYQGAAMSVIPGAKIAKGAKGALANVSAEMANAYKVSSGKGTSPGGVYSGFSDDIDRYVKQAPSEDHARNEVLANKFYQLWGVPVAPAELVKLPNGNVGVASHVVKDAYQLSEHQGAYHEIPGLGEHFAADAMLANWDAIGAGYENPKGNILIDKNGHAIRIDQGGALQYGGLGGSKGAKFGNTVGELQTMRDPGMNPTAAEAFGRHYTDPENPTANKIANTTDEQIRSLVDQYGPVDLGARQALADKLIARRDDLAKQYGIKKGDSGAAGGRGGEGGGGFTPTSDPKLDAMILMQKTEGDAEEIAEHMWGTAAKGYTDHVDEIYKHLPHDVQEDVNAFINDLNKMHGDPWDEKFHAIADTPPRDIEPAPDDWYEHEDPGHGMGEYHSDDTPPEAYHDPKPKPPSQSNSLALENAAMDWLGDHGIFPDGGENDHIFNHPVDAAMMMGWKPDESLTVSALPQGPVPESPKTMMKPGPAMSKPVPVVPKLMQINKTHSPEQVAHALKDTHVNDVSDNPALVTPKQLGKIKQLVNTQPPEALANAMWPMTELQKTHIYTWLDQKQMDAVGTALGDITEKAAKYEGGPKAYAEKNKKFFDWQHKKTEEQQKLYEAEQDKQAQKEYLMGQGQSVDTGKTYSPFDPEFYFKFFQYMPFEKIVLPKAHKWTPPDIPHADLEKLIKEHGGSPYKLYHSSMKWGPDKPGGMYPVEGFDPKYTLEEKSEKAFFTGPDPDIVGQGYYGKPSPYVGFGKKAALFDWSKISSSGGYDGIKMKGVIEAGRMKGLDVIVVKNIRDVPNQSLQEQVLFLNVNGLKAPHAKMQVWHKAMPLAGVVGGFTYSWGTMKGKSDEKGQMAKGGKVMPLNPNAPVGSNIKELHTGKTYAHTSAKFGKKRADKQAIAIALSVARKKALGGPSMGMESMVTRSAMSGLRREGMINSSIPGRTDKLPMRVRAGSYVLPADIPSALGQGNSMAGAEILKKMFSSGPFGINPLRPRAGRGPRFSPMHHLPMPKKTPGQYAEGGEVEEHVPIIAAGGEYIIHPGVVRDIGHGDVRKGHRVLDKFVLDVRKKNVETLKKLPGPQR